MPPKHLKLLKVKGDGGVGATGGLSVKVLSGQGAAKWSADSKQVTVLATQPQSAQAESARTTQATQTQPRTGKRASNLGLMGVLIGTVCLLFIVTAFLRRILGKKK